MLGIAQKSAAVVLHLKIHSVGQYYGEFSSAIAKFYKSCSDQSIGGKDIVVEIDEKKMGKRKYNRGHRVEGMFIVFFYFISLNVFNCYVLFYEVSGFW